LIKRLNMIFQFKFIAGQTSRAFEACTAFFMTQHVSNIFRWIIQSDKSDTNNWFSQTCHTCYSIKINFMSLLCHTLKTLYFQIQQIILSWNEMEKISMSFEIASRNCLWNMWKVANVKRAFVSFLI
jgi:hypothetical protein